MPDSINRALRQAGIEKREVTFWCKLEEGEVQHYCPFCRQGIFRSRYRVFAILYGNAEVAKVVTPPFSVQCPKCGALFHIAGVAG